MKKNIIYYLYQDSYKIQYSINGLQDRDKFKLSNIYIFANLI